MYGEILKKHESCQAWALTLSAQTTDCTVSTGVKRCLMNAYCNSLPRVETPNEISPWAGHHLIQKLNWYQADLGPAAAACVDPTHTYNM